MGQPLLSKTTFYVEDDLLLQNFAGVLHPQNSKIPAK